MEDMNGSRTDGNALSHADSGLDDGANSNEDGQIAMDSRSGIYASKYCFTLIILF